MLLGVLVEALEEFHLWGLTKFKLRWRFIELMAFNLVILVVCLINIRTLLADSIMYVAANLIALTLADL